MSFLSEIGKLLRDFFSPEPGAEAVSRAAPVAREVTQAPLPVAPPPPVGARRINAAGLALVQGFEKLSLVRYLDQAGIPTYGWGHVILPGDPPSPIDRESADLFLEADLYKAEEAVTRSVIVPLNDNEFSALCSFAFNVGIGSPRGCHHCGEAGPPGRGFEGSTLLARLNQGDLVDVPAELMQWHYVKGKPSNGLIRRRQAEGELWRRA